MTDYVVPSVPAGGNTKTPTVNPAIKWCFTLNNYTNAEYDCIKRFCSMYCRGAIIGKEVGEQGTPHLQGYIEFKTKARPKGKFKNKRIHWEKAKGTKEENFTYCSKDDDYWTLNNCFFKTYDLSLNLYPWQNYIVNKMETKPDDRQIHWIYDDAGCRGKTVLAKWLFLHKQGVVILSGKSSDMKNGIVQYELKNGCLPRIIIINIPRSSLEYVSYSGIEEIKDMFFFSGKYEGGMVCGANPHVLIFANEEPNYHQMSADRWVVRSVDELNTLDVHLSITSTTYSDYS
jgi:hypothetical protein